MNIINAETNILQKINDFKTNEVIIKICDIEFEKDFDIFEIKNSGKRYIKNTSKILNAKFNSILSIYHSGSGSLMYCLAKKKCNTRN